MFCAPNDIAAGGITGIATIVNMLTAAPVGVVVIIINIPIILIAARKFGAKFLISTAFATASMSVMTDLAATFLPVYSGDKLLCAVFGGVLLGTGLALIFMRGATTGGVDVIAKIINMRYPHFSMGVLIMLLDAVVIVLAAIVYRHIENALYATVAIYAQTKAIDFIVYGAERGKIVMINSKKYDDITNEIMHGLHRGATLIKSQGAYSKSDGNIIFCAVRAYEAAKLHRIVREKDKDAFVVTFDAGEIKGEGFSK